MAITGVGESQTFQYTGGIQTFKAPFSGVYKLEVIGARGGIRQGYGTANSGLGGFAEGYMRLEADEVLYVCCGGRGSNGDNLSGLTVAPGGYNGGGAGGYGREWTSGEGWAYGYGASGGGATHIARYDGTLEEIGAKNIAKILLVAGGGGGESEHSGSTNDYTIGNGGGQTGSDGANCKGGTQTTGYAFGLGMPGANEFGNRMQANGGAGGGLYGGFAHSGTNIPYGGAGGSGYIGGVPSFVYKDKTYAPSWKTGYSGANGNGSAKITFVAKGELPVIADEQTIVKVIVDGIEAAGAYVDGLKIFCRQLARRWKRCARPAF